MRRRAFLGSLATAIAGATLDPERLLWIPGRTAFFDMHVPGKNPTWGTIVIDSFSWYYYGYALRPLEKRLVGDVPKVLENNLRLFPTSGRVVKMTVPARLALRMSRSGCAPLVIDAESLHLTLE